MNILSTKDMVVVAAANSNTDDFARAEAEENRDLQSRILSRNLGFSQSVHV